MEILRGGFDKEVAGRSMRAIQEVESELDNRYIDFVRNSGEVVGLNYRAAVIKGSQVSPDMQQFVESDAECFVVENQNPMFNVIVTNVVDLDNQTGGSRTEYTDGEESEYHDPLYPDRITRFAGSRLIREIFIPGSHAELSELAEECRASVINPDELSARVVSPEEMEISWAKAKLGELSLSHIVDLENIYEEIAYSGCIEGRASRSERVLALLHAGDYVELVPGTKFLYHAKQLFIPERRDGSMKTSMYLNYDIPFGPVRLHFREDIEMMTEYGKQAAEYFEANGIGVDSQSL